VGGGGGGDRRIGYPPTGAPGRDTLFAFAFPPGAATATEAPKEQATMGTGNYTHGAAVAAQAERGRTTAHERSSLSSRTEAVGRGLARYGLAVVVGWIGLMKFTAYEAEGIRPFVASSPLMSWAYGPLSVRGLSAVLGVVEVAIALLIAARPLSPRASAAGSALAVGMFLTTLSFLVTTPGVWEPSLGGFPALSAVPGQFLIKDLALLGISLWTLGEAWKASEQRA
jgi:reactive chlorine resistance protein C